MAGLAASSGGSAAVRAGRAFVELFAKDAGLSKSLDRVKRRFTELVNLSGRLALAGAATAAAMAPVVSVFTDFDDAIRLVKAVTQATETEFDSLRNTALELGRTTSFTAAQVAGLMGELGKAGFKPKQIEDMTAAVLNLARATGTDATLSAGVMASAIRQFDLEASDATRVADAFTAAANLSFNSVEDLAEAMKYAGPVVHDLGMSLEDTLAILGGLGNVGIRGSEAGTALRRISVLAASGNKELEKLFGVAGTDAAGNLRPLVDILDDIQQSLKGLGNAEKSAKLNEFFGLLGITGASAIGKSAVSIRELRQQIGASGGVAARTAKEMDSGLGGSIRILKSAVEGTAIALGESFAPVLTIVGEALQRAAQAVTEWLRDNRELAVAIGAVVVGMTGLALAGAGVLAAGLALKLMATAVLAVVAAVKLLAAGLLLLTNPIAAAIASVAVFVATWATLTDAGKEAASELGKAFESIGETFRQTFDGIGAAVKSGNLELAFQIAAEGIKAVWFEMLSAMGKAFAKFVNDNRDRIVALGAILGGVKGGLIGSRFGVAGALIGGGIGAAGGGFGADKLADVLGGLGHNPGLDAAAAAARGKLAALVAKAKGPAGAGGPGGTPAISTEMIGLFLGGGAAGGIEEEFRARAEAERIRKEMRKHRLRVFDAVKGSFVSAAARSQFGYGDKGATVEDKQLREQQAIKKAAEAVAKNTAEFIAVMRLG